MREWTLQGLLNGTMIVVASMLVGACGDETTTPPGRDAPTPEVAPDASREAAVPPMPRIDEIEEELPGQVVGLGRDLDAAWEALHDPSAVVRAEGIERLLAADGTLEELLHHAVRQARWGRDVGLLADLVVREPYGVVEPLLEHIWRSHNRGRVKIMTALRRHRRDCGTAAGILLLQIAGAEDIDVRHAAFRALAALIPGWQPTTSHRSKGSGPELAVFAFQRMANTPREERTWTDDAVWASFFAALHVEGEFYGPAYVGRLLPMLEHVSLTNDLRARVGFALARYGPDSALASRILIDAGADGFDTVVRMLRDRDALRAALGAAPHMGGRATLLLPTIVALLGEDHDRPMVLASLGSYGTRLDERSELALHDRWLAWRKGADAEGIVLWSGTVIHVLQLARPGPRLSARLASTLASTGASVSEQRVALQLLPWTEASARRKACEAVAAFAAANPSTALEPRSLRESLERALRVCTWDEATVQARRDMLLAESPELAPFLLRSGR